MEAREVYCDSVRDLLADYTPPSPPGAAAPCTGAGCPVTLFAPDDLSGLPMRGMEAARVAASSVGQVLAAAVHAHAARAVGATAMNAASSRSHCVLTVRVEAAARPGAAGGEQRLKGCIHLVGGTNYGLC